MALLEHDEERMGMSHAEGVMLMANRVGFLGPETKTGIGPPRERAVVAAR